MNAEQRFQIMSYCEGQNFDLAKQYISEQNIIDNGLFQYLCINNYVEMVRWLLEYYSDYNPENQIIYARQNGYQNLTDVLISFRRN